MSDARRERLRKFHQEARGVMWLQLVACNDPSSCAGAGR